MAGMWGSSAIARKIVILDGSSKLGYDKSINL